MSVSKPVSPRRARARVVSCSWLLALVFASACQASRVDTPVPEEKARRAASSQAAASAPRSRASTPDSSDVRPLVVFLGDSLCAGLHLPAEQAFPSVLQRQLAGQGAPFRLVNAGVSGDTSAGGLSRVAWILKQSPQLVVLELGANDGLRGLPLATVERNLRAIVAKIKERGAQTLLLGMRLPPNYGADYTAGFEAIYARIAADLQVVWVPFFLEGVAGVPELNLADGLHPSAEGHERIASNVAPVLKQMLERL